MTDDDTNPEATEAEPSDMDRLEEQLREMGFMPVDGVTAEEASALLEAILGDPTMVEDPAITDEQAEANAQSMFAEHDRLMLEYAELGERIAAEKPDSSEREQRDARMNSFIHSTRTADRGSLEIVAAMTVERLYQATKNETVTEVNENAVEG